MAFAGASLVFVFLGFAVREAEDNQIGSTSTASMWTFFLAGLCLYVAAVAALTAWRRTRTKTKEAARTPLPSK
jgi:NhaP-type Na+/H+ or K+/H+ antiporter